MYAPPVHTVNMPCFVKFTRLPEAASSHAAKEGFQQWCSKCCNQIELVRMFLSIAAVHIPWFVNVTKAASKLPAGTLQPWLITNKSAVHTRQQSSTQPTKQGFQSGAAIDATQSSLYVGSSTQLQEEPPHAYSTPNAVH
jgi:hypothetical protein